MHGGVGDHVSSIVALNYIISTYTHITPRIYTPDYFKEFTKYFLPNSLVYDYSAMKFNYNRALPTRTTEWDGVISPMRLHCTDYAFMKLCDNIPDIEHRNYPQITPDSIDVSKFNLPDKFIVLTTGYTASVRAWKSEYINGISNFAINNGLNVVFLGQTSTKTGSAHNIKGTFDDKLDYNLGINLIDKTSLLEAAAIMAKSQAVLGVDNGLLHIAACTQVPIIAGYTTVDPKARIPIRNNVSGWNYYAVTPDNDLECRFCQSNTNFLYGHKYTNCLTKTFKCVDNMEGSKFIRILQEILNK